MMKGHGFLARRLLPLAAALSVLVAALGCWFTREERIASLAGFAALGEGRTLLALVEERAFSICTVDRGGVVEQSFSIPRRQGGEQVSLADLAVDEEGAVYLLRDFSDPYTGEWKRQELTAYQPSRLLGKRLATHRLEDGVRYRWLSVSSAVLLLGTDDGGAALTRTAYEAAAVRENGELAAKSVRTYPLNPAEGIWKALPMGMQVAYISMSGKVFLTGEGGTAPAELYPARELSRLMYPMFLCPESGETVLLGEQESGDLVSLSVLDGATQVRKPGTEPFSGQSSYAPRDLAALSMRGPEVFSGVIRAADGCFELVVSDEGGSAVIPALTPGLSETLGKGLALFAAAFPALFAALAAAWAMARLVRSGRTILVKLAVSTLPVLVLALCLFGWMTYRSYSASVRQSFQKQVVDEGNLLTALFGTESFEEVEYPYDYPGEAYQYLSKQMRTRQGYNRTAYYERDSLYTGVDARYPCFYPFSVTLCGAADELHRRAAFSGAAATGVVDDNLGRRITCVTPVGGASGDTVYLVETGIYQANMDRYTGVYIRNYCLVSLGFLAAVGLLLMLLFMRILRPLGEIKAGLEQFAQGDREVRLKTGTEDELADICRVFNMLAGDIDAQLYNLKTVNDNYYRFLPPRLFALLGKENMGELDLTSNVEGVFCVLGASLRLVPAKLTLSEMRELTNRFFSLVNAAAMEHGATVLADGANLSSVRVLCPGDGGEACVEIALASLARLDAENAGLPVQKQLDATFVVHRAGMSYGICGDEKRFLPAVISGELDWLAAQQPLFRQLAVRLVVTGEARDGIDPGRFFHRYIGNFEDRGHRELAMYEFYDGSSPEATRLLNATRDPFDKAMELYREGRYYDAKNLFTVVLRENQFDNVARYYLFQCEKRL